ncbi:FecR family protein [Pollutibacter soli]|uniref:FecR family protein n=1 Tax=Pollutibacter soli TaxID=3034157 RepID=UPI003013D9A1
MEKQDFIELLKKHIQGETSEVEEAFLKNYLQSFQDENVAGEINLSALQHSEDKVFDRIRQEAKNFNSEEKTKVRKIYPRVLVWAAAVAAISLGLLWFFADKKQESQPQPAIAVNENNPSDYNRATLTLSTGQKVELNADSLQQFSDNGIDISNQHGTIYYPGSDVSVLNTMSTPRGAQFKLMLSDSTLVWLNAESSITYPTAFNESERKVVVTGEAYFEVKKNPAKPFKVEVQDMVVEVLGTHFNVMAYANEKNILTTLLEGEVKVHHAFASVQLKPSQQASLTRSDQQLKLIKNVDTDEATAWLRGEMNFDHSDIQSVMTQLSRWYDIDVKYELNAEDILISGKIFRKYTLPQVLEILEGTHTVKFSTNGKQVTVKSFNN